MNKTTYGQGNEYQLAALRTVADTTPVVSTVLDLADKDNLGLQLIADGGGGAGGIDGAWKIEVSNNYAPGGTGSPSGQVPSTARWIDITASALWVDAVAAVAHGTAATRNQYVQPKYPVGARSLRVTFTASTGTGSVGVFAFAKSFSG